jgi:RNA polymerase sigma factor (sigma-70 family)
MRMSGESLDFTALYRAHAPAVFRRARTLLRSAADAHEVTQELFLGLCERPELLRDVESVAAYLYRATTHACFNRMRNGQNQRRLLREQLEHAHYELAPLPDELSALHAELLRMPEPLGQLAVYYYFDELTQEEIAPLLACSRRQVGNLLEQLQHWLKRRDRHAALS